LCTCQAIGECIHPGTRLGASAMRKVERAGVAEMGECTGDETGSAEGGPRWTRMRSGRREGPAKREHIMVKSRTPSKKHSMPFLIMMAWRRRCSNLESSVIALMVKLQLVEKKYSACVSERGSQV
jgi:hypothetical protein